MFKNQKYILVRHISNFFSKFYFFAFILASILRSNTHTQRNFYFQEILLVITYRFLTYSNAIRLQTFQAIKLYFIRSVGINFRTSKFVYSKIGSRFCETSQPFSCIKKSTIKSAHNYFMSENIQKMFYSPIIHMGLVY